VAVDKLAAKLVKVTERLAAEAPDIERPGADLIAWYLCADRLPAVPAVVPPTRRYPAAAVCARFVVPVIGAVRCQDIRVADMQKS
jgi:hypothetical protein